MYKSIEPEEGDFIPFHIWENSVKIWHRLWNQRNNLNS